jgi:serine/threonine protein kinase/TPR repeat protein
MSISPFRFSQSVFFSDAAPLNGSLHNAEEKIQLIAKKYFPESPLELRTAHSISPLSTPRENKEIAYLWSKAWGMPEMQREVSEASSKRSSPYSFDEPPELPKADICFEKAQKLESRAFIKPKDVKAIIRNYEKAYELGHKEAAFHLAEFYQTQFDLDNTVCWYRIALKQGDGRAALSLAEKLQMSESLTEEHKKEVIDSYKFAYETGAKAAACKLGDFYLLTLHDVDRATDWYQQAANEGDPSAAYTLYLLFHAIAGKENEAIAMYRRAYELEYPHAQEATLAKLTPQMVEKQRNLVHLIRHLAPAYLQQNLLSIAPGSESYQMIKRLIKYDVLSEADLQEMSQGPHLDKQRMFNSFKKIDQLWLQFKESSTHLVEGSAAAAAGAYEFIMEGKEVYFNEGTLIGKGHSKIVSQGYQLKGLNHHIWAKIPFAKEAESHVKLKLNKERAMLATLHAEGIPHLVEAYGNLYASSQAMIMVQKGYGKAIELFRQPGHLEEKQQVLKDVAEALFAMHAKDVVHCDIKPDNIFYEKDEQMRGKLGDFGGAVVLKSSHRATVQTATPAYMPPEYFRGIKYASKAFDCFGFGVTIFEAMTATRFAHGDHLFYLGNLSPDFYIRSVINVAQNFLDLSLQEQQKALEERLKKAPDELIKQEMDVLNHFIKSNFDPAQKKQLTYIFNIMRELLQENPAKRMTMQNAFEALNRC